MQVFAIFILFFGLTNSSPNSSNNDEIIQNILDKSKVALTYLGQVENKMYFIDADQEKMDWPSARGVCRDSGMELGEYTVAEYQFIRENIAYENDVWVGGSVKGSFSGVYDGYKAFEWQSGGELTPGINFHHSAVHFLCAYFQGDVTFVDNCFVKTHGVLCQLVL